MKICKTCLEEKDDEAFAFRRTATGLRMIVCKPCYSIKRLTRRPPLPTREYPIIQRCRVCHIEKPVGEFPGARSTIRKTCRSCKYAFERIRLAGLKWCRACKTSKPPEEFYFMGTKNKMRRGQCITCVNAYESTTDVRSRNRVTGRLYRTGFTQELWEKTLVRQQYGCAICSIPFAESTRSPHGDHCHVSMQPRGILCHKCNTALGLFGDDPARLRKAAAYLEHAPCDDLLQVTA